MSSFNLSGPAMAAPDGEVSDFDNPPNNNSLAWGAFMLMLVVSTLCVAVRGYGRVCVVKKIEIEDGLIVLGYAAYIATLWTDLMFMKYPGYFVHTWNATLETEILSTYYVFLFGVLYSVSLALLKVSIPLEWSRLFVPRGTQFKSYFWWGTMTVVAVQSSFLIVILVLLNVQCIPHQAIWDITIQSTAKCIPLTTLQKLSASVHLISDIAIFLLPQKIIYDLNLSLQKKLGLAVVFGLGFLGVICSVFRLVDTLQLSTEPDVLYYTGPVLLWCTAEITCGFFVACAPILPRVVKETPGLRKIFGGRTTHGASSAGALGIKTIGGGGGGDGVSHKRKKDNYSQIDDYGVPLDELKGSESTEHLHKAAQMAGSPGIVCTTQIAIVRDDRSERDMQGSPSPWSRA